MPNRLGKKFQKTVGGIFLTHTSLTYAQTKANKTKGVSYRTIQQRSGLVLFLTQAANRPVKEDADEQQKLDLAQKLLHHYLLNVETNN